LPAVLQASAPDECPVIGPIDCDQLTSIVVIRKKSIPWQIGLVTAIVYVEADDVIRLGERLSVYQVINALLQQNDVLSAEALRCTVYATG
jgi:hypothetical protein